MAQRRNKAIYGNMCETFYKTLSLFFAQCAAIKHAAHCLLFIMHGPRGDIRLCIARVKNISALTQRIARALAESQIVHMKRILLFSKTTSVNISPCLLLCFSQYIATWDALWKSHPVILCAWPRIPDLFFFSHFGHYLFRARSFYQVLSKFF